MADATENVRKLPSNLEFLPPNCPICADSTDPVDGGLSCYPCGIAWDSDGTNPERIDPDAKQCPSLYRPGFGRHADEEYRCWQDAGHKSNHHNPDAFYGWVTSKQTGQAAD
jgi:hypothetical protein